MLYSMQNIYIYPAHCNRNKHGLFHFCFIEVYTAWACCSSSILSLSICASLSRSSLKTCLFHWSTASLSESRSCSLSSSDTFSPVSSSCKASNSIASNSRIRWEKQRGVGQRWHAFTTRRHRRAELHLITYGLLAVCYLMYSPYLMCMVQRLLSVV